MFEGFPLGIPGIGLEMDGAMQQAAQPGRQAMAEAGGGMNGIVTPVSGLTLVSRHRLAAPSSPERLHPLSCL